MNFENAKTETLLIVDDHPSNLQVLFTFLEKAGFRVLAAQDGENALQIAEATIPDLILLDILMPGIDGFQVCQHLKNKESTQNIPVIFLTALSDTINKVKGFEVGGVDYVTKPIEQQELLARIQTHLTLKKMRQQLTIQNAQLQHENYTRKLMEAELRERTSQLQRGLNFEGLVRRITEKIRDSLDETQILQTATEELVEVLQVNSCQIELYDPTQATATIAYEHSHVLPQSQGRKRRIAEFPELYQQLLQKVPLQFAERIPQFNPRELQCTRLICPIFDHHENKGILGNLWLLRPKEEIFAEFEVQLVQQVASQCAIAIRQARLYEAAQQQVQELEKLNRLKDDFLKSISHELRSPMSSMKLAVQTLEKLLKAERVGQPSPTFARVLKIFHQASQRHNQLVDDLLTLCYIDAKAEGLSSEWINLQIWIHEIIQLFVERAHNQQLQLVVDLPEELPLLRVDISTLERILIELLTNACKYTPAGQIITLQVRATEEIVELNVINSGVEIPKEEQERIFDQFYRIPNNDPWQYGGTGLGLTLVKKMVELLGASIEVKSSQLQTEFSVKLFN
ncbi:MAG: response regulator [Scytonematopsis contorta HA4267-MV1]|jgi:signal transduction histidine kinase/DNA-binding response OmpR family regulator|nr:response regulator [Scytonematopsis contorta HA4267-MV1]